jgi:site-specific recombinase XerD
VPVLTEKATHQPTAAREQVDDVIRSIKGTTFTAVRDRAIMALLWSSGIRRSGLIKLKLTDVAEGFIRVESAKGGRPRLAPLSSQASTLLLRYLRARDKHAFPSATALWLGERGPLSACRVRELLERRSAPCVAQFPHGMVRGRAAQRRVAGFGSVGCRLERTGDGFEVPRRPLR